MADTKPRLSPEKWNPSVSLGHGEFMHAFFPHLVLFLSFFSYYKNKAELFPTTQSIVTTGFIAVSCVTCVDTLTQTLSNQFQCLSSSETSCGQCFLLFPRLVTLTEAEYLFFFSAVFEYKYVWTWIDFTNTLLMRQKYFYFFGCTL